MILLPNSPQAGSEMLNDMVASFTASNQIGEAMKNQGLNTKNQRKRLIYNLVLDHVSLNPTVLLKTRLFVPLSLSTTKYPRR